LTNAFPAKHGRPSTSRRVIANGRYASFSEGDALPPAWVTLIEATAKLVDLVPEVPWAAVGIDVSRDGKLRLVQRGCQPVRVSLIGAELRMALESTTSGLTRKSWSSPHDAFGIMDVDFDLAPGASHALPAVPGFEPAPGERLVVHLKARMQRNFDDYGRTYANITVEGASSL
jgi:hypothetical protein